MKNRNPKVDAYIKRKPAFAQPILKTIRRVFHKACPEIEEHIKWGVPSFEHFGMVGSMAAFKQHVGLGLWKAQELKDPQKIFTGADKTKMWSLKLTTTAELPTETTLVRYIKQRVKLNKDAAKTNKNRTKRNKITVKKTLHVPADLAAALKKNNNAKTFFDTLPWSGRRDYVEWITGAKQKATREKRLQTTIEWLRAGKPKNWKYMKTRPEN